MVSCEIARNVGPVVLEFYHRFVPSVCDGLSKLEEVLAVRNCPFRIKG